MVARRPHPRLDGYDVVALAIERVDPIPQKADLLRPAFATTIDVAVRRALLGDAAPGARLSCRAKRTPDGALCEANPAPGDFVVMPD